jgi:hypothetical protein
MTRIAGTYPNRAPLKEIDHVIWLTPADAIERLTHEVEKRFLAAHSGLPDSSNDRRRIQIQSPATARSAEGH